MARAISTWAMVLCIAGLAALLPAKALAACPDDVAVQALAADILAAVPSRPLDVATMADGLCAQDKLVAILAQKRGGRIGYKAGLTSQAAQKTFGVSEPIRGVLFADMMLDDGAKVTAGFAALPRFEADLIAVVADAGINEATTPAEVLKHLSAIHPFIELPDLVINAPAKLSAPVLTSINAGARLGVLGKAITVEPTDAFLASLTDMKISVVDQSGKELTAATGSAVLDHPLNSILWLHKNGVTFKPGDMVSVGSFGPLLKPAPGLEATVTYNGLPGNPSVSVVFE